MAKPKKQAYVLTLKLETERHEVDKLNQRFHLAEHFYNQLIKHSRKRLTELKRNKAYLVHLKRYGEYKSLEEGFVFNKC